MKSILPPFKFYSLRCWLSLFQVHLGRIKSPRSLKNEIVLNLLKSAFLIDKMLQACTSTKIKEDKKNFVYEFNLDESLKVK